MFNVIKSHIGSYETIEVLNKENNTGFQLIPSFGARINKLRLANGQAQGTDLVLGFENDSELKNDWTSKSAILFPFPNRIDGGKFTFNHKEYQFPINEEGKNNALHGFLTDAEFEVCEINLGSNAAAVKLSYDYAGDLPYFPFAFKFELTYTLQSSNRLNLDFKVTNEGQHELPFGIGWHPYFFLPNSSNTQLAVGDFENIVLDDRFIPNGETIGLNGLSSQAPLRELQLDHCYRKKSGPDTMASLVNSQLDLKLDIWANSNHFNYLQLYTPAGDDSIAIEPMTCNVDVYNNKMGLRVLNPSESFNTSCGVTLC